MPKKATTLEIDSECHKMLKVYAAANGMTMTKTLEQLIRNNANI